MSNKVSYMVENYSLLIVSYIDKIIHTKDRFHHLKSFILTSSPELHYSLLIYTIIIFIFFSLH
jgi:hypothetical protein